MKFRPGSPYRLIYDGDCAFCTRTAKFARRWARGKLEITPSQTPGVLDLHPGLTPEGVALRVYLLSPSGRLWGGAEAVARTAAINPAGGIALLYYFPLLRPIVDRVYAWVARNRKTIGGCGDSCSLPGTEPGK